MSDQILRAKDSLGTPHDVAGQLSDNSWGIQFVGEITNLPDEYKLTTADIAALQDISDRAGRLLGHVQVDNPIALDSATLSALESITATVANFPSNQTISGTVALDAGTLAALESITALVSNFPAEYPLSSAQITALQDIADRAGRLLGIISGTVVVSNFPTSFEVSDYTGSPIAVTGPLTDIELRASPIPVSISGTIGGTVELGATTLAALETITVVATNLDIRDLTFASDKVDTSGSVVALDATTLAALESITVTVGEIEIKNDAGNPVPISAASLPLPAGAATAANQLPDNHNVVVTSVPTTAVTGTFLTDTQLRATPVVVSGTIAATQSGSWTIVANAGTNLNTSTLALESGGNLASLAAEDFATQATLALIKAKTDNLDVLLSTRLKPADTLTKVATVDTITNTVTVTGSVSVSNFPATQAISAVSLPLPTGAATAANQLPNNHNVVVTSAPTTAVTGSFLTDTQLRASAISVSGSSVGTVLGGVNIGQKTSNTSAVQINAGSVPATNGILVQGLSTNDLPVFVGGSGVTTANGFELSPGQSVPFTASNINLLYIIGGNATDKICWTVL